MGNPLSAFCYGSLTPAQLRTSLHKGVQRGLLSDEDRPVLGCSVLAGEPPFFDDPTDTNSVNLLWECAVHGVMIGRAICWKGTQEKHWQ